MNLQVIASPDGTLVWVSGALRGGARLDRRRPLRCHPGPATGHAVFIAFAWIFILIINLVYARRR
jgi:hypothetical protein